jgi:hypothetical protein
MRIVLKMCTMDGLVWELYLKVRPLVDNCYFLYAINLFVLGTIIGWKFIFSTIKQPSIIKRKFADEYIILIVSILNHSILPTRFILFTFTLGLFIARRLVFYWSITYPTSILVVGIFPFLSFFCVLFLFTGILSYP